jgi:predicted RND superfamily exporter protein
MSAGFEKQMPVGHEYIQTFERYRGDLFGANRLNFVVKARTGTIWNQEALTRLYDVTQAVQYLPNVDRVGVQSLWTPNSYVNEITEEGFRADQIIDGTITPEALTPEIISRIQRLSREGGFVGTLVAHDQASAMITAELSEIDREGNKLDYVAYNRVLEEDIRKKFEDGKYEIQIIGFAKQIGDIADGAAGVLEFCGIALLLTGLAVYWYCRSLLFADVAGVAVRHPAPPRVRPGPARRAGAFPGVRHRRLPRHPADQFHRPRACPRENHGGSGA